MKHIVVLHPTLTLFFLFAGYETVSRPVFEHGCIKDGAHIRDGAPFDCLFITRTAEAP